jgi:predicted transcriptional regulator
MKITLIKKFFNEMNNNKKLKSYSNLLYFFLKNKILIYKKIKDKKILAFSKKGFLFNSFLNLIPNNSKLNLEMCLDILNLIRKNKLPLININFIHRKLNITYSYIHMVINDLEKSSFIYSKKFNRNRFIFLTDNGKEFSLMLYSFKYYRNNKVKGVKRE